MSSAGPQLGNQTEGNDTGGVLPTAGGHLNILNSDAPQPAGSSQIGVLPISVGVPSMDHGFPATPQAASGHRAEGVGNPSAS